VQGAVQKHCIIADVCSCASSLLEFDWCYLCFVVNSMRETTKGGTNDYRISLTLGALQNCGRFMESVLKQLQKYG